MITHGFTLAILCYNEEGTIEQVVRQAVEVLHRLTSGTKQVLVVDDASTDASAQVLQQLQQEIPMLTVIRNTTNQGIGGSTRMAHTAAIGDLVYVVSGDGQAYLEELFCPELATLTSQEFILFERSVWHDYSLFRKLVSRTNRWLNRLLFGVYVSDINWNKVIWKEQINAVSFQLQSVLIDSEIVLRLLQKGYTMHRVPTQHFARTSGVSKGGSWASVWKSVIEITDLWKSVHHTR